MHIMHNRLKMEELAMNRIKSAQEMTKKLKRQQTIENF